MALKQTGGAVRISDLNTLTVDTEQTISADKIYTVGNGPVIEDSTTGTKFRISIDNNILKLIEIT